MYFCIKVFSIFVNNGAFLLQFVPLKLLTSAIQKKPFAKLENLSPFSLNQCSSDRTNDDIGLKSSTLHHIEGRIFPEINQSKTASAKDLRFVPLSHL